MQEKEVGKKKVNVLRFLSGIFVGISFAILVGIASDVFYMRSQNDATFHWYNPKADIVAFELVGKFFCVVSILAMPYVMAFVEYRARKIVNASLILLSSIIWFCLLGNVKRTTYLEFPARRRITTRFYSVEILER